MYYSRLLYLVQTLLIGGSLFLLVRREARLLQIQVITWTVGVISIMLQFEPEGQLGFYSNDQIQYVAIVRILTTWSWAEGEASSLFWWTEYSKIPYPTAAVPLALSGIHFALALKTVALICLLALSRELLDRYQAKHLRSQTVVLYLTGCGLIGVFFSLIALRETMMMYFAYQYSTKTKFWSKLASITVIYLLRSHLAAAMIVAELAMTFWTPLSKRLRLGYTETPLLIVGGVTLGYMMFSWRFNGLQGYNFLRRLETPFNGDFGITETLQIAANFGGLQFLTAAESFVRLSVANLFLLRIVFSDTIVIPSGFTFVCLIVNYRLKRQHKYTLLAFTIYVSIVTNTDFNSFRQNIPLMPLMGVVILDFLQDRKLRHSVEATPVLAGARRPTA